MPGLTTPGYALATPAPLPPPGPLPLTPPVGGVPGVPANPYAIYRLDSGDRVRVIVFGQDNHRAFTTSTPAAPSRFP
jgi:polysaccharide export outer membrane protein